MKKKILIMAFVVLALFATLALCSFADDAVECDHEFTVEIIPANCVEPAYVRVFCTKCGYEYKKEVKPNSKPLGHNIQKVPGKEPTCTVDGCTDSEVCANCGVVVKEASKILASEEYHKYITVEDGDDKLYTCTICGATYLDTAKVPETSVVETVEPCEHVYKTTIIGENKVNVCELCGHMEAIGTIGGNNINSAEIIQNIKDLLASDDPDSIINKVLDSEVFNTIITILIVAVFLILVLIGSGAFKIIAMNKQMAKREKLHELEIKDLQEENAKVIKELTENITASLIEVKQEICKKVDDTEAARKAEIAAKTIELQDAVAATKKAVSLDQIIGG